MLFIFVTSCLKQYFIDWDCDHLLAKFDFRNMIFKNVCDDLDKYADTPFFRESLSELTLTCQDTSLALTLKLVSTGL